MEIHEPPTTKVSFKEKLLGMRKEESYDEFTDWLSEYDEEEEMEVDVEEACLTMRLTKEEKAQLCGP